MATWLLLFALFGLPVFEIAFILHTLYRPPVSFNHSLSHVSHDLLGLTLRNILTFIVEYYLLSSRNFIHTTLTR